MAKRFASHTDDEIDRKRTNLVPKNTENSNRRCAKALRTYLLEKEMNVYFEQMPAGELNDILSHYYLDLRKSDGTEYKTSTLENMRHGLNRYLNSPPYSRNIDIIRDPEFMKANQSFKTAMAELKSIGKGETKHHPAIADTDLSKMYSTLFMSPDTPMGLFNKVQFEIRLYFCRRGSENMAAMTKSTFQIYKDPDTGMKYVKQVCDELTKNRREAEKEGYTGIMPSDPTSSLCPVASFQKYMEKLHPDLDRLWQYPLDSFADMDQTWYCNRPIGKDILSKFMTNISKRCELSQIYTNHSVRTTGVTILTKRSFSAAQIMSLTGHKSVSSLATYHRVSDEEKVKMGHAITSAVRGYDRRPLPALPASSSSAPAICANDLVPSSQSCSNMDTLADIDLDEIFGEFFPGEQSVALRSTSNTSVAEVNLTKTIRPCPPMTLFQGCKIGSVQIFLNQAK